MFRSGRWVTTFLFIYLHCFRFNSAAFLNKNCGENELENVQNCNRTRNVSGQTYRIFEPRDWVDELKYLEYAVVSNAKHETNAINDHKNTLLDGTNYCKTCLNIPNVSKVINTLLCSYHCGIITLKNKTTSEIKETYGFFELKNKSIDENENSMANLKNGDSIKYYALVQLNRSRVLQVNIGDVIMTNIEHYRENTIKPMNRGSMAAFRQDVMSKINPMSLMYMYSTVLHRDEDANAKKLQMRSDINMAINTMNRSTIAVNRLAIDVKNRSIDTTNRTKMTHNLSVSKQVVQMKNKTVTSINKNYDGESEWLVVEKWNMIKRHIPVVNWLVSRTEAKTDEPATFSNIMGNGLTSCAAMFMYAMINPLTCSRLKQ